LYDGSSTGFSCRIYTVAERKKSIAGQDRALGDLRALPLLVRGREAWRRRVADRRVPDIRNTRVVDIVREPPILHCRAAA
jgi:hypothetical protein